MTGASPGKIRWNYDNIRRLTATRYPATISSGDSAVYAYDEMGNRTSMMKTGNTTNYSYNLPDNKLLSLNDMLHSWSYDANGNNTYRTDGGSYDLLTYDYENRLTKVWHQINAPHAHPDSVQYDYDGLGQRRRSLWTTDTTRYTWDGLYPVVEWNNQGKLKQTFIYANGLLLGLVDSTVTTNKRYYVLHDGLGSSVALTDSAANIKRSLIYSDFGEKLANDSTTGAPVLNRLYAGYSWDGSPANFYWMKYRQTYDPGIGRFGQEDFFPLSREFPPKLNRYIYTENSPLTKIDPSGLFCFPWSTGHWIDWNENKVLQFNHYIGDPFTMSGSCFYYEYADRSIKRELVMQCVNPCCNPPNRWARGWEVKPLGRGTTGRILHTPGDVKMGHVECQDPYTGQWGPPRNHFEIEPGHLPENDFPFFQEPGECNTPGE